MAVTRSGALMVCTDPIYSFTMDNPSLLPPYPC